MTVPWKGRALPLPAGAIEAAAQRLGIETAALRAVWEVESGGRYFLGDGSVIRRFEPHHMPGSKMHWRQSMAIGPAERERLFQAAFRENPDAAMRATSWGAPQIMGFNHRDADYSHAAAMIEAFANSAQAQLDGFVSLIDAWGIATHIRAHNWLAFASRYNGNGQAAHYSRLIEAAYRKHTGAASPVVLRVGSQGEAVRRLQVALGIPDDGVFGPRTKEAVERFQRDAGIPVDGVAGARTWAALDRESLNPVQPVHQPVPLDATLETVTKIGGVATAVGGVAATVNEVIPPEAIQLVYGGAVVAGLLVLAAFLVRRART